jgi:hypothetical protein
MSDRDAALELQTMTADRAWELVRPYIRVAATDVLRRAAVLERELAEGVGPIVDGLEGRLRERVALGEGYGWNLYRLETAWTPDLIESELTDELLDAIVYRALSRRLQVLAIQGLP